MFLYFDSLISYEYLVKLNFEASLCGFWYSCFGMRLMFLTIFLSGMHLSDFLCAFLINVQCNIDSRSTGSPGTQKKKKKLSD